MHGTSGRRGTTRGTTGTTSPLKPIFVSVAEAATALSLSRREIYRLLDDNHIESVERGRRRLIVVDSLHAYVTQLRSEAAERRKAVVS